MSDIRKMEKQRN